MELSLSATSANTRVNHITVPELHIPISIYPSGKLISNVSKFY